MQLKKQIKKWGAKMVLTIFAPHILKETFLSYCEKALNSVILSFSQL